MKCVKIEEKRKLVTSTIEKPESKDGRVVIKVEASGICGSDIHYWESGEPKGLVMGHEFAGTVVDVGNRKDLQVGDKVTGLPTSPCGECRACKSGNGHYCRSTWAHAVGLTLENPGAYAEYTTCRSDLVRKLPDVVSFDEGAMIEPTAVALHASNLADIKVGSKVLVIGGGIIGLMACEFAKLEGASYVAMVETNEKRGKKAVAVGKADEWFDALQEDTIEKLVERSDGGFDIVFDCCGNSAAVSEAILATRPGGKIILVGVSTEPVTIPTVVTVMGEISMIGAIAYTEQEFDTCIGLIASKKLNVKKYVDEVIRLDEANEAFVRLTSGKDDAVKIIFHPNM